MGVELSISNINEWDPQSSYSLGTLKVETQEANEQHELQYPS